MPEIFLSAILQILPRVSRTAPRLAAEAATFAPERVLRVPVPPALHG